MKTSLQCPLGISGKSMFAKKLGLNRLTNCNQCINEFCFSCLFVSYQIIVGSVIKIKLKQKRYVMNTLQATPVIPKLLNKL